MAERQVKDWITIDGNHVPIYEGESKQDAFNRSVALMNENKKKADIERNKQEADKLNNPSKVKDKIKLPTNIDKRFNSDIISVAESMHTEFPEASEIHSVIEGDSADMQSEGVVASMDGLGRLRIRKDLLNDYEYTQRLCESHAKDGYLAGGANFKDAILAHEFAHNLDHSLSETVMNYAPTMVINTVKVKDEKLAEHYSKIFGKDFKVGDEIQVPAVDHDKPFLKIDDKLYSYSNLSGNISDTIVPLAISNIQNNWKKLGFSEQPTTNQLVNQLSGYAARTLYQNRDFCAETFAESYANYKSFGDNASVLSQEIMRLTNQLYKSAVSNKRNGIAELYMRMYNSQ